MQTDPLSVLWFIKYLIDHNLKRPDKKQLRLLSFWTNLSEKKLNDWFSKTYQNYIRKNDQKSAHKKLAERAIKIGRQLRRPNSLKISRSSIKSNKSSPYERKS
uniref:HD1-like protein n=1 Tax=Entrophospora sp. TaxID=1920922 RepID=A0A3R5TCH7_9GLOM|nr:HD1-like protein [Entrophospora sp.]